MLPQRFLHRPHQFHPVQRVHPLLRFRVERERFLRIVLDDLSEGADGILVGDGDLDVVARGDVLVIQGVMGCSNMGGQSATIAKRQGFVGAIVDGTVRDPEQYRGMGWPVWCRGFTPITGTWRMQTVTQNSGLNRVLNSPRMFA